MWYTVKKEKSINHRGVTAKEGQYVWLSEAQASLQKDNVDPAKSQPKDLTKCASAKCWELGNVKAESSPRTEEPAPAPTTETNAKPKK